MKKEMRRVIYLILLFIVVSILTASIRTVAESKSPMTVGDFLRLYWVNDPSLSPDGSEVAFTVTYKSLKKNKIRTVIYIDSVKKKQKARLFTRTENRDFQPRFSPDGKFIGFISTRTSPPQIWIAPVDGGEPRRLTDFPTGIRSFVWSPDGSKIAFSADVWMECGSDMVCQKEKTREDEQGAPRIFKRIPFRVWNEWRYGRRTHIFTMRFNRDYEGIVKEGWKDITPFDHDIPPIDLGSSHDFTWSPDGKYIAFVMNETDEVAWNTNNDVFLIPSDGGKPERISESKGCDSAPYFSPDGKYLSFLTMKRAGFESDKKSFAIYELSSKKLKVIAPTMDKTIIDYIWAPDSKGIYFWTPEKGRRALYYMDLKGHYKKLYDEGHNTQFSVTPDGKSLIFRHESSEAPPDIYRIDVIKTKVAKVERLTFFNKPLLSKKLLGKIEEFWFKGARGDNVHGFLMKPPGFNPAKSYPAIFLLHGGPQGDWEDSFHPRWNTQMFASRGFVLVMINFHGSVGYGQKFTDSISRHWGDYPLEDIMKGYDYVTQHYKFIDPKRIGAAGASYGGYLANWLMAHTDKFKAYFTHASVFDLHSDYGSTEELWFPEWEFGGVPWKDSEDYEKFSPSSFIKNIAKYKTPVLVTHGAGDFRVDPSQGIQLFTILQRLGVESKMILFPHADHFVTKPKDIKTFYEAFLDWFEEHLKK